jgi:nucleoside-diphosphate-sugar epimerase
MNIVTGGTGIVGARLIFDLISKNQSVTALIRKNSSIGKFKKLISFYTENVDDITKKVNWVNADITDLESLNDVIPSNSKVYHCAAKVSFNKDDKQIIEETNITGTANIVNVCIEKNIQKFCHVSSIGALGSKINGYSINENTPWGYTKKSTYSLSKYYSEMEVWRGIAEGLNAVIVNPAVILAPGNWDSGSPQLFSLVANGIKYYTEGTTAYVDVRDVSSAMISLMNSNITNEKFILASETLSYKDVFEKIASAINAKAPHLKASEFITSLAYRLDAVGSFILNKQPKITYHTHRISHSKDSYSGEKIKKYIDFSYTPVQESINFIGACFLKTNTHTKDTIVFDKTNTKRDD